MNATPKSHKTKSPAAPSRSLKTAVEDVRKLYAQYGHASFTKSEIGSELNMSATSGPFGTRLYSLRAYGLLDAAGGEFRVSDVFRSLDGASPGDAEFKRHALAAIRRSDVFAEVLDEFPSKLPAKANVAHRLETQKRFNRDKANTVAGALEDSLRFAGLLDGNNNLMPVRGGSTPPADEKPDGTPGDTQDDRVDEEVVVNGVAMLRTEVPVSDGRRVVVHYPADLTGQEAQKVGNVLKAIVE